MKNIISFDVETHPITNTCLAPPIVCASFHNLWNQQGYLTLRDECLDIITELLKSDAIIAGANIAYDFGCVATEAPELLPAIFDKYERDEVYDVSLGCFLDLLARGYVQEGKIYHPRTKIPLKRLSLELVTDILGIQQQKRALSKYRLRYDELEGLPISSWPKQAVEYSYEDARITYLDAEQLLREGQNQHDQPRQARAAFALHLSAMWGIQVDPAEVQRLAAAIEAEYSAEFSYFKTVGVIRPEGTVNKKVLESLVTKAFNGTPPKTPKGNVITARDVIADSGDPILERYGKYTKLGKQRNTYVPALREAAVDRELHPRPNPVLASGRTSYAGLIQTMPRKGGLRRAFVPREGKTLCSIDYSGQELVTLAFVTQTVIGFSKLADALNDNADPHLLLGADLLGIPFQEAQERYNAEDQAVIDARQAAKPANFGFPGMMGTPTFVLNQRRQDPPVSVCRRDTCGSNKVWFFKTHALKQPMCLHCLLEGDKRRNAYLRLWSEVRPYWAWIEMQLTVNSQSIKQLISNRVRGGLAPAAAANTLFQGLGADATKDALWQITKEAYTDSRSPLYGTRVLIFLHDEILTEMPREKAVEAAHRKAQIMLECLNRYVPSVKKKVEGRLMDQWDKSGGWYQFKRSM